MGAEGHFSQPIDRAAHRGSARYLHDHPAVTRHGHGVPTGDLTSYIESFADYANSRVRTVGAEQYAQGRVQKFETFDIPRTVDELVDELADGVVYVAMLAIKVQAAMGRVQSMIGDD